MLHPRRRLLDYSQAAEYLGTTERHMRRLRHERRISSVKVGGKVRFDRKDLDAFIEARKDMAEDFHGVG
jgi:excisionase family DNA binding protein